MWTQGNVSGSATRGARLTHEDVHTRGQACNVDNRVGDVRNVHDRLLCNRAIRLHDTMRHLAPHRSRGVAFAPQFSLPVAKDVPSCAHQRQSEYTKYCTCGRLAKWTS